MSQKKCYHTIVQLKRFDHNRGTTRVKTKFNKKDLIPNMGRIYSFLINLLLGRMST